MLLDPENTDIDVYIDVYIDIIFISDIMHIIVKKIITYCILDDVTCFARKRRHQHRIKQAVESFLYLQDMSLEIPCQNWPGQRHDHLGERLMSQA
jgi:hypothetical protein